MIGHSAEKMKETRAALLDANPYVVNMYCKFDCSKPDMEEFAEFLNSCQGNVSKADSLLVVHNAATFDPSRESLTWQLRDTSEDVMSNFVSAVAVKKAIIKEFSNIRNKAVVNVTSNFKVHTYSGSALYCASEFVVHFIFCLCVPAIHHNLDYLIS